MGPHDEFIELCAVSTSGSLTEEEKTKLQEHLADCQACREVLKEYQSTAEISLPLFAAASSDEPFGGQKPLVDVAEATFRDRLKSEEEPRIVQSVGPRVDHNGLANQSATRVSEHWNHVWLAFAAAVVLAGTLGIGAYQAGLRRGSGGTRVSEPAQASSAPVSQQLSDAGHDRQVLRVQMAERDRTIEGLRRQLEKQTGELGEIRREKSTLEAASGRSEEEKRQLTANQAAVNQKLETAQATLEKTQGEFDALKNRRSDEEVMASALQAKVDQLSSELRDKDETIDQQQELLAHDRDIRELMGSRDLYIAEVFDIAKTGATQKPYGRVFFTKGKSLIFYAYDLDRQSGFRNTKSFQVWGQRGGDREDSLSLGMFYEDNIAKKRWILKSNDPRKLDEIDAVFVTLEPHGGSPKPSGKPLLFAYLKVRPNHP